MDGPVEISLVGRGAEIVGRGDWPGAAKTARDHARGSTKGQTHRRSEAAAPGVTEGVNACTGTRQGCAGLSRS